MPYGSPVAMFSRLGRILPLIPFARYSEATRLPDALCKQAKWGDVPDTDFLRACFRSTALFTQLFSALRKCERAATNSIISGHSIVSSLQLVSACLEKAAVIGPEAGAPLIDTLCSCDIFGALENVLVLHTVHTYPTTCR